jgi:hypothetical protein
MAQPQPGVTEMVMGSAEPAVRRAQETPKLQILSAGCQFGAARETPQVRLCGATDVVGNEAFRETKPVAEVRETVCKPQVRTGMDDIEDGTLHLHP